MREPHMCGREPASGEGRRKSTTTDKGELCLGPLKSQLPLSAQQSPARCAWPPRYRACLIVSVIYAMSPGAMTDMTKMAIVMLRRLSRHEFSFPQPILSSYFKSIPLELAHVGGAQNYSLVPRPGSQPWTRGTPSEKHHCATPPGEA